MRSVTGIELGADSCILVRTRADRAPAKVTAVHGLRPDETPRSGVALGDYLAGVRRRSRFPARARVVVWGLDQSASAIDPATNEALTPLIESGFQIGEVMTPSDALAILAHQFPRARNGDGTAWLALNRSAAAIAIVHGGELVFSREFAWNYRPAANRREELLQRYTQVAHLAAELRHAFDVVRQRHRRTVDAVVTCGDLPDLRSLTMPLIEELDMEVETLDSLDGLDLPAGLAKEIGDKSPALRLACAAGTGRVATSSRELPSRRMVSAAAVVLLSLVAWGGLRFAFNHDDPAATTSVPERATAVDGQRVQPPTETPALPRPTTEPTAPPIREIARPAEDPTVTAATTGREALPAPPASDTRSSAALPKPEKRLPDDASDVPAPRPSAEAIRDSRNDEAVLERRGAPLAPEPRKSEPSRQRPPVPLNEPLPVLNSVVAAPDKRLAVIDGVIVREGEAVGPRVLVRIESDAVLLREPSGHHVRVPLRRRVGAGTGS